MRVMQGGGVPWSCFFGGVGRLVTYSQPEPHIAGGFFFYERGASSMTPSPRHSSSLLLLRRQDAI